MRETDRQRVELETKRLQSRQSMVEDVHQHYSRFGERVVQIVMHYALRNNGLRELLSRLPVQCTSQHNLQIHQVIVRFIVEHGVSSFLDFTGFGNTPLIANEAPLVNSPTPQKPESQKPKLVYKDRRSGTERRAAERRSKVDAISKNKRFGKNRRSPGDRRKEQIPPPWKDEPKDES